MKKLILSTLLLTSACIGANQTQVVRDAVYVEVKGVPGSSGRLIIYKGIYYPNNAVLNAFNKLLKTPLIAFYDKNGKKIAEEPLTEWRALDTKSKSFSWKAYNQFIADLSARLGKLPKASKAILVPGAKGHGNQHIHLVDKHGNLLAEFELNGWDTLKIGDYIPKKAIHVLQDFVKNAEDLKEMKISEIKSPLMWRNLIGN